MSWNKPKLFDYAAALIIMAAVVAVLLATVKGVGFTRDEGYYFKAARLYQGWFGELGESFKTGDYRRPFEKEAIDRHLRYNAEHPLLAKEMFALSDFVFHDKLGWMSESTAMRFPGMLWAGLCAALLFLFGVFIQGRLTGLLAVLLLMLNPRFFHHSHLACFDVPITAMVLFTVYAYFRGYSSRKWAVLTGLIWGLAISTKLNALFLPLIFILHWLAVSWKEFGIEREKGIHIKLPAIPIQFISMLIFGPIIFIGHWPYLWPDIYGRISWYFNFHLQHEHYPIAYLNEIFYKPPFPWEFPLVMSLYTVPAAFLILFGMGFLRTTLSLFKSVVWSLFNLNPRPIKSFEPGNISAAPVYDGKGSLSLLLIICVVFPIALIAMPNTPIFGGVKHWFPALPFMMLLAARELSAGLGWLFERGKILKPALAVLLLALIMLPAMLGILRHHPFGISYYNYFAGGIRGGAEKEMMRGFWGYETASALDFINDRAERNSYIYFHRTNYDSFVQYQRDELLRKDFRYANRPKNSSTANFNYKNPYMDDEYDIWRQYKTRKPAFGFYIDEVPIHRVYIRPKEPEPLKLRKLDAPIR